MTDEELKTKLTELVKTSPISYSTMLKHGKQYEYLLDYVNKFTASMPDDIPIPARIYYTLTGTREPAKCKVCGNDIPHGRKCNALTGYESACCSPSCAQKDPDYRKRQEERSLAKYGTRAPQMSDAVKAKTRQTMSKRTDDSKREANEKRKRTNLAKYGVESVSQTAEVKDAVKRAWSRKTAAELSERRSKTRATKLRLHGDENYVNSKKAAETRASRKLEDPEYESKITARRQATMNRLYGVKCATEIPAVKEAISKSKHVRSFNEYVSKSEYAEPMFSAEYYAAHRYDELKWRCKKCGKEFSAPMGEQIYFPARCPDCHPLHDPASRPEKELAEFIRSIYNGETIENTRTVIPPNELDVYLPAVKIAFELDGLYWRSEEMGTPPGYHLSKTERCEAAGIRLIHVTEAEWVCKRAIVESRIKAVLGIYDERIFARKCEIRNVGPAESKAFLEKNHIQGSAPAKVRIGLFKEDELVALMTFGKCRFDDMHEWEMIRFCSRLNAHVVAGAGRLLAHFERKYNPSSVVSYADRRWSQGQLYHALGFRLDHASKPDYRYWNRRKGVYMPESRIKYQKHKLPGLLQNFNPALSESENMKRAGFMKIYDCGNLVFTKNYVKSK